jgi:predicted metal-dependent enzyme (double-stranded beta helix superfamily)
MSYLLENFCDEVRAILTAGDDSAGRDQIRQKLELLLQDDAFCAEYVGSEESSGLKQIYQDPNLHFCVLAYNMADARTSPPHDHGTSWAVYGQAEGYTDMTIWDAADGSDGNIKPVRTFRLEPGQAGLFDVREIHSIQYPVGSKFVRVTGADMSLETRRVFDPETGTVREIEHIATGNAR